MIYVFLADGFEEIEALATLDVLRRAGYNVAAVGVGGLTVTGAHGITVTADISEKEVVTTALDAVVLPGGQPGTRNLEKSSVVVETVHYCAQNGKYIAAICAAPSILGHLGLLKGKRAICFPGFEQELTGAVLSDQHICIDGKIITAQGAGVAIPFALAIVSQLSGEKAAEKIRVSMQCM